MVHGLGDEACPHLVVLVLVHSQRLPFRGRGLPGSLRAPGDGPTGGSGRAGRGEGEGGGREGGEWRHTQYSYSNQKLPVLEEARRRGGKMN